MAAPDAFFLADELHGIPEGGHAYDAQGRRGQVVRDQQRKAQEGQAQDKEEGRRLCAVPVVESPHRYVAQANRGKGEYRQDEASPLEGLGFTYTSLHERTTCAWARELSGLQ